MARTKTVRLVMIGSTTTPCTSAPYCGTFAADHGARDDFVRAVDLELAGFRVEHQVHEVHQITGVERARVRGHRRRQTCRPDDLHAVTRDHAVRFAQGAVTPLPDGHV